MISFNKIKLLARLCKTSTFYLCNSVYTQNRNNHVYYPPPNVMDFLNKLAIDNRESGSVTRIK